MTDDPLWFKDAIFYELRIRSFYDSDNDGIGDLRGLTEKLDYLHDLGVTTLWLLPFYPSPLRDDGYDTADYMTVHPVTGTLRDFKTFLKEAHRRGLKVVTELVLNHTSDQHPWFQRARRSPPGSKWRDFYVWSDNPRKWPEARIIFQDFETSNWTWDPVAQAYFWHRFYSHQPDLNFDNPEVHKAMFEVVDHWFSLGVDGMRLDAVPYLYERAGTNCENLKETHDFLKKLRKHIDSKFSSRMLLAEANQWPEDAVAYFGDGDECHMAFHFPIMPRLFMSLRMEDRYPLVDILEQTPEIPENCQWAIFLRNHDELTLEMVTDEERDYMVGAYAADRQARINLGIRRRLAPLLENNRRRIELMNALLFSLPGTPVIYYGDEIGMGDNVYLGDRDGVRTPMQWSPDRNAGFSKANPQRLILPTIVDPEYHYETVNVEIAQSNTSSLLWWTKRLIALRKQYRAFGRGTLEVLSPSNGKVLAFLRRYHDQVLLVVVNLSRFAQYVELDLSEFKGAAPLELFGQIEFPHIGDLPYLLTLAPHGFYWFALARGEVAEVRLDEVAPNIEISGAWTDVLSGKSPLDRLLPKYLLGRRWFRSKARSLKSTKILDAVPLGPRGGMALLLFVEVVFAEGDPEVYVLPVNYIPGLDQHEAMIASVTGKRSAEKTGVLVDASADPRVAAALLDLVVRKKTLRGKGFELRGCAVGGLRDLRGDGARPTARAIGAEQSNTSYLYGDRIVGKLIRRVEEGESLELEVLQHLRNKRELAHVPELQGYLEAHWGRGKRAVLGVFQEYVQNQGDAWTYTTDELQRFLERVVTRHHELPEVPPLKGNVFDRFGKEPPNEVADRLGGYLHIARLLGRRTAELHVALATPGDNPAFDRDRFTALPKRAFYQSLRNLTARSLQTLKEQLPTLPEQTAQTARVLLRRERDIRARLRVVLERDLPGARIRVHGDYHLGQVLYTGRDFVIIDFEGEPARSPSERRRRRSPMADVAGMLRSFHYAVFGMVAGHLPAGSVRPDDLPMLEEWAPIWYGWTASAFLETYLEVITPSELLPADRPSLQLLLEVHLLEKSLYELGYELNNRPGWAPIPLEGILGVLDESEPPP